MYELRVYIDPTASEPCDADVLVFVTRAGAGGLAEIFAGLARRPGEPVEITELPWVACARPMRVRAVAVAPPTEGDGRPLLLRILGAIARPGRRFGLLPVAGGMDWVLEPETWREYAAKLRAVAEGSEGCFCFLESHHAADCTVRVELCAWLPAHWQGGGAPG